MSISQRLFICLYIALLCLTGCVPTEPVAQDTVPIAVTRVQATFTPEPTTVPITATRVQPTPTSALTGSTEGMTIIEVMAADGRFSIFLSLLETAGLTSLLNGEGPFTVFAPSDAAFAALRPGAVETLRADPELSDFLKRHITPNLIESSAIANASVDCDFFMPTKTLQGMELIYGLNQARQRVIAGWEFSTGEIGITAWNLVATNGFIYAIEMPILPLHSPLRYRTIREEFLAINLDTERMVEAIYQFGGPYEDWPCRAEHRLMAQLDGEQPYTVFLPTDAAMEAAETGFDVRLVDVITLSDLALYHVIEGALLLPELEGERSMQTLLGQPLSVSPIAPDRLRINGQEVRILEERPAKNGVIYVIDRLLTPPGMDLAQWPPTIAEAIETEPDFPFLWLIWGRDRSYLRDYFDEQGPFTVFVIPDTVLSSLSEAQRETLLALDSQHTLYYEVEGIVDPAQQRQITTVSGELLWAAVSGDVITIGNDELGYATIVRTIQASNGVIYVLDRPLLPPP